LSAAVIGPLLGGWALTTFGVRWTYLGIGLLLAASWFAVSAITPPPPPEAKRGESIWESVVEGIRYVAGDQIILGSMALDLFAVLFGGAVAMLPVFAREILHVGAEDLGIMTAAPMTGALVTMLWATRHPPVKHAGRNLFISVTGFGIAMIVFALSTSFYLSVVALFFSGVFDGVSVVIRRSIVRIFSPDNMRGRIGAVAMIFIGSSNQLGELESGLAASWLGTVRSVWMGGVATLLVVAGAAVLAPKLRQLSLDPSAVAARKQPMAPNVEEEEAQAQN
jgi:MFS family permease